MSILRSLVCFSLAFGASCSLAVANTCGEPIDFLTMPIASAGDPMRAALKAAYPNIVIEKEVIKLPSGKAIPLVGPRKVSKPQRLEQASIGDMFVYVYPLDFALEKRKEAFYDPGRVRNEAFFRALLFDNKQATRKSLTKVRYRGARQSATYSVTTKYCIHVQLKAALDEIAKQKPPKDKYFNKVGGSFNWRKISGTNRLSSHSFGSAVDINTQLGKYWKWVGVKPGEAARYDNVIPEDLVRAFERRGFIWGGKWHHFDGMHFEYRPELILYSRLVHR